MVRWRKLTRRRPRPCTVVQLVSLGLDLNLPVGTSLARVDCDLTKDSTSAAVTGLTAAGWVLRLPVCLRLRGAVHRRFDQRRA
jgi:hypothetical protein